MAAGKKAIRFSPDCEAAPHQPSAQVRRQTMHVPNRGIPIASRPDVLAREAHSASNKEEGLSKHRSPAHGLTSTPNANCQREGDWPRTCFVCAALKTEQRLYISGPLKAAATRQQSRSFSRIRDGRRRGGILEISVYGMLTTWGCWVAKWGTDDGVAPL